MKKRVVRKPKKRPCTSIHFAKNYDGKLARRLRISTLLLQNESIHTCKLEMDNTLFPKYISIPRNTTLNLFPSNSFRYYLTHSSVYFSSFPHGTCSLSVSCPYLALGGIYLPLRAAIPNNSTL